MRASVTFAALALLAAPPGVLSAADPVGLRWSLKAGDAFYATTTQELDQNIKVMGQAINQTITTTTVARFEVLSAKDGGTEVKMTYTQMKLDAGGALAGAATGALTDRFKGATLTATFDKGYELTKLAGYDKFLDQLSDGDDNMRKVFRAMVPEAAVKVLFAQVFVAAPKDKVTVGDKWSRTDKVPLAGLGDMTNKTQYTLSAVKDGVATLKTTGDVTFKAGDGDDALPFKIIKADLKAGEVKGTVLFDTKAGRLKSSSAGLKMKGTMTIEVQNQQVDAELDQKVTTTVEVSEKNPVKD